MDFKYPEKAYYYLSIAAETHIMQHMQEYINSLANAHDPRTLSVIDRAISMEMAEGVDSSAVESWRLFLKRRKAYILTDAQWVRGSGNPASGTPEQQRRGRPQLRGERAAVCH